MTTPSVHVALTSDLRKRADHIDRSASIAAVLFAGGLAQLPGKPNCVV